MRQDARGDDRIGEQRQHTELVLAPQALGDLVSEHPAQQWQPKPVGVSTTDLEGVAKCDDQTP